MTTSLRGQPRGSTGVTRDRDKMKDRDIGIGTGIGMDVALGTTPAGPTMEASNLRRNEWTDEPTNRE